MQNLKEGDYIHVVKTASKGDNQFYGTVLRVENYRDTGELSFAIVKPEGAQHRRLVFPFNKITVLNLIEANE